MGVGARGERVCRDGAGDSASRESDITSSGHYIILSLEAVIISLYIIRFGEGKHDSTLRQIMVRVD